MNKYIKISKEVQTALLKNKAVVALETTIISHGMPYPDNYEIALELESIIRSNECIPATIGIIDGIIHVGLSKKELLEFSQRKDIIKASRRDIPYLITKKLWGSLTVSATMMICAMVGIRFFVTGGLGGVHYGVNETFDISADLDEFTKSNVCVICAGAKAILDLKKTVEYLETKGVTVIGYQSDTFAAFYSRDSGIQIHQRFDTPLQIAKYLCTKDYLGIQYGTIISNPIMKEYEIPKERVDLMVSDALALAKNQNITGKNLTPFLLKEMHDYSLGESIQANKQLIKNNATLGSFIAKTYFECKKMKIY